MFAFVIFAHGEIQLHLMMSKQTCKLTKASVKRYTIPSMANANMSSSPGNKFPAHLVNKVQPVKVENIHKGNSLASIVHPALLLKDFFSFRSPFSSCDIHSFLYSQK